MSYVLCKHEMLRHVTITFQWHTQDLARGRGCNRRSGGEAPSRQRQGGVGAEPPATKNFCIFYLKKIIFSAFNYIIYCNNVLCIMQTRNALTCDNHFPVAHSGFGKGEGLQSEVWGQSQPLEAKGVWGRSP